MPVNRLLYEGDLAEGSQVQLTGDEAHHLSRVLRARPGDSVELINGRNQLAQASVDSLDRSGVQLTIHQVTTQPPLQPSLILIQALLKPSHLETVIEKATELGAHQILLFPGQRSDSPNLKNPQRLATLIRSAVKQCGRLDLPTLQPHPPIAQWGQLPAPQTYFGDLRSEAPSFNTAWKSPASSVGLVIGPESGLAAAEIAHLDRLQAQGISLHPLTLRAETASIVALGLAAHWLWQKTKY